VKRLTARRQCRKCGKIYNLSFKPPKVERVCDECGGELYQRKDDSEDVIRDRLSVYHQQTEPVLGFYGGQGKLVRIDGALGRDRVYEEIVKLIEQARAK
jgi:adenylate kinase